MQLEAGLMGKSFTDKGHYNLYSVDLAMTSTLFLPDQSANSRGHYHWIDMTMLIDIQALLLPLSTLVRPSRQEQELLIAEMFSQSTVIC